MQIALGPMGQFATLALAIAPDVNGIAELRQKPGFMMIYHRFMWTSGHLNLLKLTCCLQYQRCARFPQTTLCFSSDDINSCMNFSSNDRAAALAQRAAGGRGRSRASQLHHR